MENITRCVVFLTNFEESWPTENISIVTTGELMTPGEPLLPKKQISERSNVFFSLVGKTVLQ